MMDRKDVIVGLASLNPAVDIVLEIHITPAMPLKAYGLKSP